ncbi:MAG: SlyX family protein [Pseudomonadota bacterium]
MKNVEEIEAHVAHLQRMVEDLSDVVARQDAEVSMLRRQVALLLEREATREAAETGSFTVAERKPPHY